MVSVYSKVKKSNATNSNFVTSLGFLFLFTLLLFSITVSASYTGEIVSVSISPSTIHIGDSITHSITVRNTGTNILPINVEVYTNGVLGDSTVLNNDVPVGQTIIIPLYTSAPNVAGQTTFTYKLYWDRQFPTSDLLLVTSTKSVYINPTPTPTTGTLNVIFPTGASVYIDGSFLQNNPATLSPGTYTVKVTKTGYYDYSTTATVTAGYITTVTATLTAIPAQAQTGSLNVVFPSGASVYVDGVFVQNLPVTLSPGTYTVKVTKTGYNDYTTTATVTAGYITTVTATLTAIPASQLQVPAPPTTGSISFVSDPAGVSVYIDGSYQGTTSTTVSGQTTGLHTVRLSKTGYNDYSTTVTVSAGQDTHVSATLIKIVTSTITTPTLSVDINPQQGSGSSFPIGLIIVLVIIGGAILAYIIYRYNKAESPSIRNSGTPSTLKTVKDEVTDYQFDSPAPVNSEYQKTTEPVKRVIDIESQEVQNLRSQIIELKNNPVVSPSIKSELNSIAKGMTLKTPAETLESLQTIAEERWIEVNKTVIRLKDTGVIFSWAPESIRQHAKNKQFIDAILELETVDDYLTRTENDFTEAVKLRKTIPDSEIIALFNAGKYSELISRAQAIQTTNQQIISLNENIQRLFTEAENVGVVPDSIKNNLQAQDSDTLKKTIEDLNSFIANAKPELSISLDHTQLSTERWHKLGITLSNTGSAHVENVTFTFSNEFETKGIKPISIPAGQSSRTDISIIPKSVGNILLEITLKYKDSKGREYTTVQEFWIDVVEKGLTTSPHSETPSSHVGQFTPKPITPKQLPPELFDHYTESEFIGKGGFARVFKAKRKDGKYVAVKIPISMDAVTGKSFIAEMQNWTKLSHPNIVRLYDFNIMPIPYFEEELCDSALADLKKPLECEETAWIIFNVCEGLKFAHAHKIIHRDLKPQNILLKNGVPKISDWGLSRIVSESTSTTATSFTPYYAAPEQINNRIKDERTDIWQIGVILYEFIAGEMPFKGDSMIEIGMGIATKDPKPLCEIKPDAKALESVVMKCLQKDPAKRYQSILELQKDLGMYLRENYTELLKKSVTAKDSRRSTAFCGDLVMINMLTGDIATSYKYLLDLVYYSKGDVKAEAQELSEQIKMRMEMGVTEIPDELIQKAEIIVHKVRLEFK